MSDQENNKQEAFEVDELDDTELENAAGGDDNFKCQITINNVEGCGG